MSFVGVVYAERSRGLYFSFSSFLVYVLPSFAAT